MVDPAWGPVEEKPKGRRAGAPVSRGRRWTGRIFKTIGVLLALGLIAGIAIVTVGYTTTKLPNPNKDFTTATTFVYYNDGRAALGNLVVQNREPLPFAEMPDSIKQAMVAAENRTFWTDRGISLRGMVRAAYVIARGGDLQGGSTITQQYIKILYLTSDRTATRKFKELFLAYKINKQLSKEKILEGYLNTIYFGHGAYGIQAASRAFFEVDAAKLSVPQAAVLASVVNNPAAYDPDDPDNRERLLARYQYVLASMAETGAITAAENATWSKSLPDFPDVKVNQRYGGPKGFLLKMVERELSAVGFSAADISGGGLRVTTTFDKDAQEAAVESAQKFTKQAAEASDQKASGLHAAIASVDVGTGEVLALYGGPDYVKNSRNWATTARPAASTFKTYALAAGLEDGFSLRSRFRGNTFTPPGESSTIRNEYSFQYGRRVNLIKATADSINTAFVDMTTQMPDGPEKITEVAEKAGAPKGAGWTSPGTNSRIALGAAEVSPLDQAEAYATFANGGLRVDNHVVRQVEDVNGKVIYKAAPKEERAVSEDIARDVTYALSDVVENGTGATVQTLNRPVAGKTGTNGIEDADGDNIVNSAWFVAYTKQISTAVMYVAGDSGSESLDDYRKPGNRTFFGGTYPALTWESYMATATEGQEVEEFEPPAYVNADSAPSQAPEPTRTSEPTRTFEPSAPSEPGGTPSEPSETSEPSQTSEPSETPEPSSTSEPSEPTDTAEPTETSEPSATSEPTRTSEPTATREPRETSGPTRAPAPTSRPSRVAPGRPSGAGGQGQGASQTPGSGGG